MTRTAFPILMTAALFLSACDGETGGAAAVPGPAGGASAGQGLTQPGRTETRKFRDWLAVCDNGAACFAFGPGVGGETGWIRVSMEAGPAARPHVAAGFWSESPDDAADSPALEIDGRRLDPSNGAETVAALASGRRLTLRRGEQSVDVSLTGASAALLWIDERQGRLGTAAALIRRGDRPASAVPAAPPLPSVAAAPAAVQANLPQPVLPPAFEAREDVARCRADTAFNETFQREITVERLGPDQELWGVPCFVGAYNSGYRYFTAGPNGADPRPLSFPTSREPTDEVVNGRYDPETRTLTAFNKGRGLGDCGIASTWVWTGREFALQAESEMRECWGVPAELWPTTWRTR